MYQNGPEMDSKYHCDRIKPPLKVTPPMSFLGEKILDEILEEISKLITPRWDFFEDLSRISKKKNPAEQKFEKM